MFKAVQWVVAGMVLQLMVGQVFAQAGGRSRFGIHTGVGLVQQKPVQDELKLSADQIEKLKQTGAKIQEAYGRRGDGGDREEARKKIEEARQAAEKETNEILSADQTKRLKEITLQQTGPTALADGGVAKEVGLSDDQRAKVKEINDAYTSETRGQSQAGGGGETQAEVIALRNTGETKGPRTCRLK